MSFEPADTQGNVVRGYRHLRNVRYIFFEIREVRSFRALLGALLSADGLGSWGVRSDEHWKDKRRVHTALNVAFTYAGLEKLGWGAELGAFEDFRQGMYARAARELGDGDPDGWPPSLRDAAHVLFTIYFDNDPASAEEVSKLRTELDDSAGLHEVEFQAAAVKKIAGQFGKREHFGFRDGFSQPALETGEQQAPRRIEGEGVLDPPSSPLAYPRWRALRLGEVLLGHLDEDGVIPGKGQPVLKNGTFMVWRKLEQHVERFERYFERIASGKERQEWLKAKVIGRWPDGTSLLESPHAPPGKARRRPRNKFDYGDDPDGAACPLGAHVRRANPRIGLKWWTLRTRRHRIVRRGMPYEERDEEGRLHRGLIFVCFNASISRQFELIQGRWLMDGDAFGLGSERDFMLAAHLGGEKMIVQGDRQRTAVLLPDAGERFVTVLGGYYLFVPGIAALRRIAREPSTRARAKLPAAAR
jgi:Dyp-type peroxidase family